jgi:UDP-glucuronate 4-epimerase
MRVLLTGVAGFIGSSVAEALLARGDEVVGLDNLDPFYSREHKERNLRALSRSASFTFEVGDILHAGRLDSLLPGVDRVVHLAALAGVRPSIVEPARYMRVNVEGTTEVLEACRRAGVSKLVVASSSSVYGVRSEVPFSEDDPCDRPASPYAASKRATEHVCATYHHLFDIGVTCLRYFTVYGPRQRPEMAIHKFVRHVFAGDRVPMFGDGASGRDYTFIDDIVAGTLAALDRQDGAFRLYNLGGAHPVLLRELLAAIGDATGRQVQIDQHPWQAGDVPITSADVSLAEAELGYQPRVSLAEGLARFVDWYRVTMLGRASA